MVNQSVCTVHGMEWTQVVGYLRTHQYQLITFANIKRAAPLPLDRQTVKCYTFYRTEHAISASPYVVVAVSTLSLPR